MVDLPAGFGYIIIQGSVGLPRDRYSKPGSGIFDRVRGEAEVIRVKYIAEFVQK